MSFTTSSPSFDNTHISIPLGIFIGLLASFIQSLGLTIQRKSHVINQTLPKHQQRVEHRRPLWLLGFTTFIVSNLFGSLVQIASLPVVILAPLGAVSLLWNAFFARLILGDVFSPWMILGTILIAGGAVLIAVFGIVPEPTHSLEDLLELFRRPAFVIYFSLLGMAVFACLALTHVGEFSWSRKLAAALESESDSLLTSTTYNANCPADTAAMNNTTGTLSDNSTINEMTPLLDRKRHHSQPPSGIEHPLLDSMDRTRMLLAISYASISGIISGMCLIFAKSGVELLLLTFGGKNQFRRWESWVLVSGLVIFALLQMWYLHKALILANPTLVCPSAFCFYNVSSIVNGLVYFDQLQLMEALHLLLVALGIVILLGGVWVVSIQSGGGGVDIGAWGEEEEEEEGEEEQDFSDDDAGGRTSQVEGEDIHRNMLVFQETDSETTIGSISNHKQLFRSLPTVRQTRSEPFQTTSLAPVEAEVPSTTPPRLSRHRHTIYSGAALLSPPSFRTRFTQRRSTVASDTQHYSASSHQRTASHPSNTFSPPLNNTVSTLGAGLQIGLSPISPGFVIVPKERRRKTSGLGVTDLEQSLRSRERRSISEGNVGNSTRIHHEPEFPDLPPTADRQTDEDSPEGDGQGRGRLRWKWLKDVFSRRTI